MNEVDTYLGEAPEPQRSTLESVRASLLEVLPDAEEGLSYGVPACKVGGSPVAGYAWFKNHCSYFPHSGSILEAMSDDLESYSWSRGTLKFAIDEPLPKELIARLVAARMEQIESG